MTTSATALRSIAPPAPDRPDAGLVLASLWHTEGRWRQERVMSGVMDAWERTLLPAAYLARHCLAGSDGRTVLNFAQWTTSAAHRAFAAEPGNQQTLGAAVRALYSADPPGRYVPHRAVRRQDAVARCYTATWYDTQDAASARSLADDPAHAGAGHAEPAAATYFYLREDGRRLFVLAGFPGEPVGAELWFRPYRGLVRPAGKR
ncbi:hypothetical protein [Streptomyces sp. Da 82-17]|uniref:hypothetical protein n=1 Tax=Streptomyces sp. Da 82-17 TaxID=3377116 RepID=UPI0038D4D329